MSDRHRWCCRIICFFILSCLIPLPASAQETVRLLPEATDELLINPGMGYTTFQRFQSDHAPDFSYPQTSIAYLRWYWDVLEPEKGKPDWSIVDNALLKAHRDGQSLHFRYMPQSRDRTNLPKWYMEEANGFEVEIGGNKVWQPDYRDPKFVEYWGALIRKCGARYDGHPWLDAVDLGSLGYWGEWHTYDNQDWMPPWEIEKKLIDIYLEAFPRTPLLMLIAGRRGVDYVSRRGQGWRADCLGDLDLWGPEHFPWYITTSKAVDTWKTGPVVFETCGTYGARERSWYGMGLDVDRIHEEALRWHTSVVNAKSSPIPKEWMPSVERFMKKMGYRLELRKLEYPSTVRAGTMMPIQMWWVNVGVAPTYRRYNLAIQLKNEKGSGLIRIDTNVTKWLPGDDVILEDPVWIPDLAPGRYRVSVGLLDPFTGKPAIKLPLKNRTADNWHDIGEIELAKWELQ